MAKNRCYHPIHGYYGAGRFVPTGGRAGDAAKGFKGVFGHPLTVPCGKCLGCRKETARQWAVRMMHESQMHEESAFLTLTYDEEHIPFDRGLDREAVPAFVKRLRKRIEPRRISYFQCGEYGADGSRPHYHLALFGYNFPDRTRWTTRDGNQCWRSATLEELWPFGFSEIGSLTFGSATYIARYVTKKVANHERKDRDVHEAEHARYERYDFDTGEIYYVPREFATMSLKPAIGRTWIEKFWRDVYPNDEVVVRGKTCRPPRYYDRFMDLEDEKGGSSERRAIIKEVRASRLASLGFGDTTEERLRMSEVCAEKELGIFTSRRYEL